MTSCLLRCIRQKPAITLWGGGFGPETHIERAICDRPATRLVTSPRGPLLIPSHRLFVNASMYCQSHDVSLLLWHDAKTHGRTCDYLLTGLPRRESK